MVIFSENNSFCLFAPNKTQALASILLYSNFIAGSPAKNDIDQCGVTFSNYLPHITAWYVDLPKENKVNALEEIASAMHADKLSCSAEAVALVELGQNGNAVRIIEQYPLDK